MNRTKATVSLAISAALAASVALADDFKTIKGKEYEDATVTRAEPDARVYPSGSNVSSPTPAAVAETRSAASAEQHYVVQNGVFFLKERVAVRTKFGVSGLNPGTRVRLISESGNTLLVTTDGTTIFNVSKDKLTDNFNEATVAAQNYYAAEQTAVQAFNAEIVQIQQERKRAFEEQLREQQQAATQQQEQAQERQRQAAAIARQQQQAQAQQRYAHQQQQKATARQAAERERLRQVAVAAASQSAQEDQRIDRENRRNLENIQRQDAMRMQESRVHWAREQQKSDQFLQQNGQKLPQFWLQTDRENLAREKSILEQQRQQQYRDGNRAVPW